MGLICVGSTPKTELEFPLLGTFRISGFNYTQSGELAEIDRKAMSLMDIVCLGGFFGTFQDLSNPGPNYLTRTEVTQDILNYRQVLLNDQDIYIITYVNQMETNFDSHLGNKASSEVGPNGTDWWFRDSGGTLVGTAAESPSGDGFLNITDQVILDSLGRNYCDYYREYRVEGQLLDPHIDAGIKVGKGGINIFFDNLGIHFRKSKVDPDQDGNNDDMQNYYDPDNITHVTSQPKAVQFIGEYRKNQRAAIEDAATTYPELAYGGNSNQYAQNYSGPASSLIGENHPYVMKEYRITESDKASKMFSQIGLSENNNWRPTEDKGGWMRSHTLWTGVSSTSGGSWQHSYNNIAFATLNLSSPNSSEIPLVFGEWTIDCLQDPTAGPGGKNIYPNTPKADTAYNAHRWAMATCMLCSAHYACSGVDDRPTSTAGERRNTVLFDEFGLINGSVDYGFGSGTTKLYHKWMGRAVDPIQVAPRMGTHLWMRQFENCLVINNTNWDDSDPDEIVVVADLPGGPWKRFEGVQDRAWNNGSDVIDNFAMPSIEAIFLVNKAWYDAL